MNQLALLVAALFAPGLFAQTADLARVVETYCSGCHNGTMRAPAGPLLDKFDTAHISENPEVWSRAYRQFQAGTMPPVGAPRPDRATYDAAMISLEKALGSTAKPAAVATSQEIATRLATLLWNGSPDPLLLEDAKRDRLNDSATLERQIRRMLADERAQAFVTRFFFPWLQLNQLEKADPDKKYFPDYDASLRDSFAKETAMFLLSQVRDDRDPIELWSANYTFLNEQLAKQYNEPNVTGAQFRRVSLSQPERAGLLGQGSILMLTSHLGADSRFTSPATRGRWIRMHFTGIDTPFPFPNAQPVDPNLPITPQTRKLPVTPCVSCHRNFFPLGYALENFDPLGRWRTEDQMGPIDASASYVDGTPTNGVVELRQVLLSRSEAFRTTITEKLLEYAAAKPVRASSGTPETLIRARQILRGTEKPRWSTMIAAVVRTTPAP